MGEQVNIKANGLNVIAPPSRMSTGNLPNLIDSRLSSLPSRSHNLRSARMARVAADMVGRPSTPQRAPKPCNGDQRHHPRGKEIAGAPEANNTSRDRTHEGSARSLRLPTPRHGLHLSSIFRYPSHSAAHPVAMALHTTSKCSRIPTPNLLAPPLPQFPDPCRP